MNFIDLFAGIGGFRVALQRAGHNCIGFCEIDKTNEGEVDGECGSD